MDRDRNLLFGVFAVQLRKITAGQLADGAAAWATDTSRELSSILVEMGALSEKDRSLIRRLVDEAVKAHDGDATATLAVFGGVEQVYRSFAGSIVLTESGGIGKAATVLAGPDDDEVPGVVEAPGRYTRQSEYNRGGMGRVLLVHDEHLGREIALKELLPHVPGSGKDGTPVRKSMPMVARFLQEARITGQLEHPSIVPVYEVGRRNDGSLYYTMKLVRGMTLAQAITESNGLVERLKLLPHFIDLCQAIAYAHSRGVIHRDIKPGNIMVGEFGETVVLDWGLAKAKNRPDVHADGFAETIKAMNMGDEADFAETAYGQALGTPRYMPPEQAKGDLANIDERSDVYSLGAVLYEILTGRPPHTGENLHEILHAVVEEIPVSVTTIQPNAPPELAAICEHAIRKNKGERYPSAMALADDIHRFQSGALVRALTYGPQDYARYVWRRYRTPLVAATAMTLFLIVFGAAYVYNITETQRREEILRIAAEHARSEAVAQQKRAEVERAEARRQLYYVSLLQARSQMEDRRYDLAGHALWEAPVEHSGWEWGHLNRALYPSLVVLSGHELGLSSASFSPDGSRIVTESWDGAARVWNADTGSALHVLSGHTSAVTSAVFSPDGSHIVTASQDHTARVWDADTGEALHELSAHDSSLSSASFSPNGSRIVTASDDRTARVWNVTTGKALIVLSGHDGAVRSASFNPDGSRIVTASDDRTARVWDARTGEALHVLSGHDGAVRSTSFSPDGARIVTASWDLTARVWDVDTGKAMHVLSGHDGYVNNASFSPDGARIVTASDDRTTRLWDVETGKALHVLSGHERNVWSATFSPDGARIVTASLDHTARVWDANTGKALRVLSGHEEAVRSASFSPDGMRIVTASWDLTAHVWNAETADTLHVLSGHEGAVRNASFSPDGTRIVTASDDRSTRLWDAKTGKALHVLSSHGGAVLSASFSPDGLCIVTASQDHTARLWDADTGEAILVLAGHGRGLAGASFSPDGARIVTASQDHTARVWDAQTGTALLVLAGHGRGLAGASFSPDGTLIVTASQDHTARVWDAQTGTALHELSGHERGLASASFSPDGARIVTASQDGTARVWDAQTGEALLELMGHENEVWSASFSPDGSRIVTASWDGTARVWDAAPWSLADLPPVDGDFDTPEEERKARYFEWKRQEYEKWVRENIKNK